MSVPEYPDLPNSSDEQTDPNTLLDTEDRGIQVVMPTSSRAIPREYPVCNNDLPSGMALYRHLRSKYPEERPYTCYDCVHTFNNLRELSCHHSNHHRVRSVSCKHCQYCTMTKVKMRQYVFDVCIVCVWLSLWGGILSPPLYCIYTVCIASVNIVWWCNIQLVLLFFLTSLLLSFSSLVWQ